MAFRTKQKYTNKSAFKNGRKQQIMNNIEVLSIMMANEDVSCVPDVCLHSAPVAGNGSRYWTASHK